MSALDIDRQPFNGLSENEFINFVISSNIIAHRNEFNIELLDQMTCGINCW